MRLSCQARNLEAYKESRKLFTYPDLAQYAKNSRGRGACKDWSKMSGGCAVCKDGSLQTLTTNSGQIYSEDSSSKDPRLVAGPEKVFIRRRDAELADLARHSRPVFPLRCAPARFELANPKEGGQVCGQQHERTLCWSNAHGGRARFEAALVVWIWNSVGADNLLS